MDIPFVYGRYVTGKNFIGRATECQILANLVNQGEHVVIYEPPKTGKTSLIKQTLLNMKGSGNGVVAMEFSVLNIRSLNDLVVGLGSAVLAKAGSTPEEYASLVESCLPGTHFVFDQARYSDHGDILSINWDVDDNDIRSVLELPFRLTDRLGRILLIMNEFQNVMLTGDGERFIKLMESVFKAHQSDFVRTVSYLMCGSEINAMAEIFAVRKFFFRQVVRVELKPVEPKDMIDYVTRHFLAMGKVIDRDLLLGACRLFRNKVWYVMHFVAICDSLSRGYVMEPIFNEALQAMVNVHQPRFEMMMNDLTTFQVSLLKAILDGHRKFSSSEVIQQYSLNTSANVKRLREALCRKEIVFFEDDIPHVTDPLFEYWVRKFYFKMDV